MNDRSATSSEECTVTSTSLPNSLIATLPGSSYTDPEVFAQEQERIFETMWFCVARSSDLAKPGAFRTVDVGRESILVTRARDSSVRAYFNVCGTAERGSARRRAARSSGPSSARTTPGPTAWTASSSRRPTSPRCPTSAAPSTAW